MSLITKNSVVLYWSYSDELKLIIKKKAHVKLVTFPIPYMLILYQENMTLISWDEFESWGLIEEKAVRRF